jgi:ankyrin repeat protein
LVFRKNYCGMTPLHRAAENGNKAVAELLLRINAEVNAKDNNGETPLHRAAGGGRTDVVELLLANKAEVNAQNNGGETPLRRATYHGHRKDTGELLRKHGGLAFEEIHDAACEGDLEKVKALLKYKPDLVFSKDRSGSTPLHWAAFRGRKDVAELLLANKADVNAKNSTRATPLNWASSGHKGAVHKDVVELLRQHGGHE